MLYLELLVVVLLTVLNCLLAMSEMALVSSRRSRLEQMAGDGHRGARTAVRLIDDPSRFLSTVQIGITLVGILAGAFGGATLAYRLGDWLNGFPHLAPTGHNIPIPVLVVVLAPTCLIPGDLCPMPSCPPIPSSRAPLSANPYHPL